MMHVHIMHKRVLTGPSYWLEKRGLVRPSNWPQECSRANRVCKLIAIPQIRINWTSLSTGGKASESFVDQD